MDIARDVHGGLQKAPECEGTWSGLDGRKSTLQLVRRALAIKQSLCSCNVCVRFTRCLPKWEEFSEDGLVIFQAAHRTP